MRPGLWGPPLVWMAAILWLSSDQFSAEHTGAVLEPLLRWFLPGITPDALGLAHLLLRKAAHLTVYAVLALLWFRAFHRSRLLAPGAAAAVALALSVAWAIVDETHQAFVPSRTPSAWDVAIDAVGATFALMAARRLGPRRA